MAQDWNNFMESLYNDGYERLFRVAYRGTKNRELARDLIQETFVLSLFQRETLMRHPNPGAWLMRTLCNLMANEQRLQRQGDIPLDEIADIPDKPGDARLEELLPVQLRASEREILLWRFEQQMEYKEMAGRLGISEALCRKRVSQAVNQCRKYLREY